MPASQNVSGVRYPKRKRAQVKYYQEEDDDIFSADEFQEEEEEHAEDVSKAKKRKSTASRPPPKQKIFPFLSLPAEIRNQIYGLCLADPAGIYLNIAYKKTRRTVQRMPESQFITPMTRYHSFENEVDAADDFVPGSPSVNEGDNASENDSENDNNEESSSPSANEQAQTQPAAPQKKELARRTACEDISPLSPALLAVCKQIHAEAHGVLWGHTFHVQDTVTMHAFLVDIGTRGASYVKRLTLGQWGTGRGAHKAYNHAAFTALVPATSLTHFTFHDYFYRSSPALWVAEQFYRDSFQWLEAVGFAQGKCDAAVDVAYPRVSSTGEYVRGQWVPKKGAKGDEEEDWMQEFTNQLGSLLRGRVEKLRG